MCNSLQFGGFCGSRTSGQEGQLLLLLPLGPCVSWSCLLWQIITEGRVDHSVQPVR
jgi:hypothetical protein